MRTALKHLGTLSLALVMTVSAAAQSTLVTDREAQEQQQPTSSSAPPNILTEPNHETAMPPIQPLLDFKDSDIKFALPNLMNILSDRRHEGWVLAAYPDPKTSRPLIGAGFSLDLPAREHPQHDPLNPHPFVEPSSAQLWQAAGLDPKRLQDILRAYDERLSTWAKRRYRKKIRVLTPQITDEEATRLLRIAAIQAIVNAKAYCRNFDELTGPQQMAVSQLVYQMGINLEEFGQFLSLINDESAGGLQVQSSADTEAEHWKDLQQTLIQSQWARLYRTRAVSVIAMLDPQYVNDPHIAELRVSAILHPAVAHRRRRQSRLSLRIASYRKHKGRAGRKTRGEI
jgi:hypothetical protein